MRNGLLGLSAGLVLAIAAPVVQAQGAETRPDDAPNARIFGDRDRRDDDDERRGNDWRRRSDCGRGPWRDCRRDRDEWESRQRDRREWERRERDRREWERRERERREWEWRRRQRDRDRWGRRVMTCVPLPTGVGSLCVP